MRTAIFGAATLAMALPALPATATAQAHHGRHHHGKHHAKRHHGKHRKGPPAHAPAWGRRAHDADRWYADRHYRRGDRRIRVTRNTRVYRGRNGRYYCRRSDGSTGLIVGAALGGLLGNQLGRGDSTLLTTVIGAGAGGLLGREIDRGNVSCR